MNIKNIIKKPIENSIPNLYDFHNKGKLLNDLKLGKLKIGDTAIIKFKNKYIEFEILKNYKKIIIK